MGEMPTLMELGAGNLEQSWATSDDPAKQLTSSKEAVTPVLLRAKDIQVDGPEHGITEAKCQEGQLDFKPQVMEASAEIVEHQAGETEAEEGRDKDESRGSSSDYKELVRGNIGTALSDAAQFQEGQHDTPLLQIDEARCKSSQQPAPGTAGHEPQESDGQQKDPVEQASRCEASDSIARSADCQGRVTDAKPTLPRTHPASETTQNEASTPSDAGREEFTGLRITNRCIPAEVWSKEIRCAKRRIVPMCKVQQLGRSVHDHDRVVIGVLYARLGVQRFANGVDYAQWGITDLADPEPRRVTLQLRGQSMTYWLKGPQSAKMQRGAVIAVMNPAFVSGDDQSGVGHQVGGRTAGCEHILRVGRHEQIAKLGDCPSLGMCAVRKCQMPCNADIGERFCTLHLTEVYAEKSQRVAAGGGASGSLMSVIKGLHQVKQKRTLHKSHVVEEELRDAKELADRAEAAKRMRPAVALELDKRRFISSEANDDYVRSIVKGMKPDRHDSFQTPVLGRGLENETTIELDLLNMDADELKQGERMLQQRAEILERKAIEDEEQIVVVHHTFKRKPVSLPDKATAQAKKRSLCELVESGNLRLARKGKSTSLVSPGQSCPQTSKGTKKTSGQSSSRVSPGDRVLPRSKPEIPNESSLNKSRNNQELPVQTSSKRRRLGSQTASNAIPSQVPLKRSPDTQAMEAAESRIRELAATIGNSNAILKALELSDKIPVTALSEEMASHLYWAVGNFALQGEPRDDVQSLARSLRRRWRLADSEIVLKRHQKGTLAGQSSSRPEASSSVLHAEGGA